MCGIIGYLGKRNPVEVLISGLKKLEYRGYDSAGIALIDQKKITTVKVAGKVKKLKEKAENELGKKVFHGGIAHTRWATHGLPNEINAHPHVNNDADIAVVHNGIIENYTSIKKNLQEKGCQFSSETDSEVLAHLIGEYYDGDISKAVAAALNNVEGTFGIIVSCAKEPEKLITARRGSPVVIGISENEAVIASDVTALVQYTDQVIYLDDNDIAEITVDGVKIHDLKMSPVSRNVDVVDWDVGAAEKGGYEHFMLKEIYDQPEALKNATRGRIDTDTGTAILSGMNLTPALINEIERILLFACGTSLNASMVGQYYFEDLADIPGGTIQAAEFRYRNPLVEKGTLALAVSQSGETADTLAALREAQQKGAMVAGICNVVGSTIARETGRGVYLHAGPEIGVASTKAFTCQVIVLLQMAIKFGRCHRLPREVGIKLCKEIEILPELIKETLKQADNIEKIAKQFKDTQSMFYIGRGYQYPVALEGALKLKEISYIHAEGYHAAELKHGPIALLDEKVPVVAMVNNIPGKDKTISNVQECKARKSPVILTATIGDEEVKDLSDNIIWVPECSEYIAPIVTSVALQLFAYYVAKAKGCSIDQPKNLAKSVTVE